MGMSAIKNSRTFIFCLFALSVLVSCEKGPTLGRGPLYQVSSEEIKFAPLVATQPGKTIETESPVTFKDIAEWYWKSGKNVSELKLWTTANKESCLWIKTLAPSEAPSIYLCTRKESKPTCDLSSVCGSPPITNTDEFNANNGITSSHELSSDDAGAYLKASMEESAKNFKIKEGFSLIHLHVNAKDMAAVEMLLGQRIFTASCHQDDDSDDASHDHAHGHEGSSAHCEVFEFDPDA